MGMIGSTEIRVAMKLTLAFQLIYSLKQCLPFPCLYVRIRILAIETSPSNRATLPSITRISSSPSFMNRSRLAHKSSSEFFFWKPRFRKRETPKNGARGSGSSTCFSCRKSYQVTSFWRQLFLVPCQSCVLWADLSNTSRNGKFIGIPTKTFVHVAVAENIWQQCSELVDNLAPMRRLLTGSQKTKISLNLKLLLGRVLATQAENRF